MYPRTQTRSVPRHLRPFPTQTRGNATDSGPWNTWNTGRIRYRSLGFRIISESVVPRRALLYMSMMPYNYNVCLYFFKDWECVIITISSHLKYKKSSLWCLCSALSIYGWLKLTKLLTSNHIVIMYITWGHRRSVTVRSLAVSSGSQHILDLPHLTLQLLEVHVANASRLSCQSCLCPTAWSRTPVWLRTCCSTGMLHPPGVQSYRPISRGHWHYCSKHRWWQLHSGEEGRWGGGGQRKQ